VITLVQNNTKPDLELNLKARRKAFDLTGATVQFKLKKPSGAILTKAATISEPATLGRIVVAFGVGDLDEAGECLGEVVVTKTGNIIQNSKYAIPIYVRREYEEVE
jgi:hypothetical protein